MPNHHFSVYPIKLVSNKEKCLLNVDSRKRRNVVSSSNYQTCQELHLYLPLQLAFTLHCTYLSIIIVKLQQYSDDRLSGTYIHLRINTAIANKTKSQFPLHSNCKICSRGSGATIVEMVTES